MFEKGKIEQSPVLLDDFISLYRLIVCRAGCASFKAYDYYCAHNNSYSGIDLFGAVIHLVDQIAYASDK